MNFLRNLEKFFRRNLVLLAMIIVVIVAVVNAQRFADSIVDSGARRAEQQEKMRKEHPDAFVSSHIPDGGVHDMKRPAPDLAPAPQTWFERGPLSPTGNAKRIALTFDDGPCGETIDVLDMLCANQVKATLFLIGENVARCPEEVRRIRNEGHDIGVHGYQHLNLKQVGHARAEALLKVSVDGGAPHDIFTRQADEEVITAQVIKTQDGLQPLIGYRPMLFRPPFGGTALSDWQKRFLAQHGITTVLWSVDSEDSRLVRDPSDPSSPRHQLDATTIERVVLSHAHDGAIVLMHSFGGREGRGASVTAAASIIARLRQQGYEFVTISQLLGTAQPPPPAAPVLCQPTMAASVDGSSEPDGGITSPVPASDEIDTRALDDIIRRSGGQPQ